jgi:hypothetical protein
MKFIPLVIFVVVIVALGFGAYKLKDRFEILAEFVAFLRERKLWWIMPLLIVFALAGLFVAITGNSAVLTFLYPLF